MSEVMDLKKKFLCLLMKLIIFVFFNPVLQQLEHPLSGSERQPWIARATEA